MEILVVFIYWNAVIPIISQIPAPGIFPRARMCNVISRNLGAASRMMSSCAKLIELDKISADPNILDECQDDKQFNGWPVPKCLYDWKIQACLPSIGGSYKTSWPFG